MKVIDLLVASPKKTDLVLEVTAPFDNKLIAKVACADQEVVDKALETAYRLHNDRSAWLSIENRIEILEEAITLMTKQEKQLALEAAREGGKPLVDSLVEAARAIDGLKICIETLRTESGDVVPMRYNAGSSHRVAFTQREPIGVVVALSAFNHPLNLIIHQVAAAVAAGCPVIVKPASDTPLSCLRFVKILHEAGLPIEWCQVIVTQNNALAGSMVSDPRVSFFSFIGSAKVGWMLRSTLAPGTRCALEHGGVAPVVLAKDANLETALSLLTKGGFYHAGQVCVSVQRVFVDKTQALSVAEQLAALASELKVGDPTSNKTDVGPLIRHTEADRVAEWVNDAVQKKGKIIGGGQRLSDSCYEPTVLLDPADDAIISNNEVFGPVVCVYSVKDVDQAIAKANALPFSFQASVFTQDIDTALRAYSQLNASAVMVNDHTAFRVDGMPFAGLKQSGLGVGGIPHTMRDMQIEKMMVIKSKEL